VSSSGTSIHLPELVIPSRNRNARVRTVLDAQSVVDGETERGSRRMTKKGEKNYCQMPGERNGGSNCVGNDSVALTITLPATQLSEELYCYCNRVSFGKVSHQATSQPSFIVCPLDDCV
jgi:hypothetical protein